MVQRKVLIVEEESSVRNLIYTLLGGLGYEGEVAYSGQQALAMIARQPFDAVLLDLRCSDLTPERAVSGIGDSSQSDGASSSYNWRGHEPGHSELDCAQMLVLCPPTPPDA
jgi:CheY-like chemotaxis protein